MQSVINFAGISTLTAIAAAATITAAAISPIGAAAIITGAYLWAKRSR